MAPLLSALVGPQRAVPVLVLLDGAVSVVLLPGVRSRLSGKLLLRLALPAFVGIPAGAWLLAFVDPSRLQIAISAVVLATVAAMASGWRARKRPGGPLLTGAGAASGLLTGIGGIGGPPIILLLLSGREGEERIRANLIGYFALTQAAALAIFAAEGILVRESLTMGGMLAPIFLASAWAGSRLFGGRASRAYRWVAYLLLAASGIAGLVAGPGSAP